MHTYLIIRSQAFSDTALGKSGPCGVAVAQLIEIRFPRLRVASDGIVDRCQVSGVRKPRC